MLGLIRAGEGRGGGRDLRADVFRGLALADGGALRLRVKSAGVSMRIAPVARRRLP